MKVWITALTTIVVAVFAIFGPVDVTVGVVVVVDDTVVAVEVVIIAKPFICINAFIGMGHFNQKSKTLILKYFSQLNVDMLLKSKTAKYVKKVS